MYAQGSNLQSCSNNGTLELLGAASPLLGHILLKTLLVLPGVKKIIKMTHKINVHFTSKCCIVSGIGGQMQTDASIWYYVLHQSSTITRFREVKRGSKTRPLDTQAHHGTRGTGASPVTRQWR